MTDDSSVFDPKWANKEKNFDQQDFAVKPEYSPSLKPMLIFIEQGGCSICAEGKNILDRANLPNLCYAQNTNQRVIFKKSEELLVEGPLMFEGGDVTSWIKEKQHGDPNATQNAQVPYMYDPNLDMYLIGTQRIELHVQIKYVENPKMNRKLEDTSKF